MRSLSARLTLVAAGVLAAFFGLAGAALDRAFRDSVEAGVREQLRVQIYVLLGAATITDGSGSPGVSMPEAFADSRYSSPASGLTAAVRDGAGALAWESPSSAGRDVPYPAASAPGEFVFELVDGSGGDGDRYHAVAYAVTWELDVGLERRLVFQVAQSRGDVQVQLAAFRRTLWAWLSAAAAFLVLAQVAVLRWGLAPLRRVAREVEAVERGERSRLGGRQPRELEPLTASLNALLASSAARLTRYRNALDDLAHSLKTPLAVLRAGTGRGEGPGRQVVDEQVERMEQSIAYHVQRGAAAGRTALTSVSDVRAVVERLAGSLAKVYADKGVAFEVVGSAGTPFAGDEGDLLEILGNLMDNACKWCGGRVRVALETSRDGEALAIVVEDDGPGVAAADRRAVLERGVRADEQVPGQGIGLALVREMVEDVYGGTIEIGASELGGARVALVV